MAPTFVYDEQVEFKLKEKLFSMSDDSFSIKRTDTGDSVFSVKGNFLSLRDSKTMYDHDGNALYKMTEAFISLRGRMHIKDCETGDTAFTLRKKGIIPIIGTNTIQVWKGDDDDGDPWVEIKGNIIGKDYKIIDHASGNQVGKVSNKWLTLMSLIDKNVYKVTVEPGTDAAVIVFLAVAIDEQYKEEEEEEEKDDE